MATATADPKQALTDILTARTGGGQYTRGAGPDQLAYGDATALNEASVGLPTTQQPPVEAASPSAQPEAGTTGTPPAQDQSVPQAIPADQVPPDQAQPGQMIDENVMPTTDAEKFLFGPSNRRDEHIGPPTSFAPAPAGIASWLPYLQAAADDPEAPVQTQALFTGVMRSLRLNPDVTF